MEESTRQELIKKYQWAGKIRFLSFTILFLFLLLMKVVGGYSYLNFAVISLIFVEAVLNRPYTFLLNRVNLYRFQFYQMVTDIIAISWVLYYMGGIEAPLINLAYYVVILWAGVVSDTLAVFFAVVVSAVLFTAVVVLGHFGVLPRITYFDYHMPAAQMYSILLGNISFLFAFGYFSARSSDLTKLLERKKQEDLLRHRRKFLAAGYLVAAIAHDIINYLITIRAYVKILLERQDKPQPPGEKERLSDADGLKRIEEAEKNSAELLGKLLQFSQNPKEKFQPTDINAVIEDALGLTGPIMKMSDVKVEKAFAVGLPAVMADKDQLQEVFVIFVLNAIDAIDKKGKIAIRTRFVPDGGYTEVAISDTGIGIKRENIEKIGDPFFTTKSPDKGLGLGLTIANEIIARHKGKVDVKSVAGQGATFTLRFPVVQADNA
jgi:signal transduction histidine kinase